MLERRFDVVIVGAGLAGVACAARLKRRGLRRFCVLDQGDGVAAAWRRHYRRLSINSPYLGLPDDGELRERWGMFMPRAELVTYLEAYAAQHGIEDAFRFGERVTSIEREAGNWHISATSGRYEASVVVVATAINRVPALPTIEGLSRFGERALHSSAYWNAEPFRGQRALVIGSGNSASDIALDLAEGGAASVTLWARAPRHVLNREAYSRGAAIARRLGMAFTRESFEAAHQYTRVHPEFRERLREQDVFIQHYSIDLSRFGIETPTDGPATQLCTIGRAPWYDTGTVAAIEAGRIEMIDGKREAIEGFSPNEVHFSSHSRRFDAVFFGTGYVPGLEEFVDGERLLQWDPLRRHPMPITNGRCRSTVEPSLFFAGFDETPYGGSSLGLWGAEIGEVISRDLASAIAV